MKVELNSQSQVFHRVFTFFKEANLNQLSQDQEYINQAEVFLNSHSIERNEIRSFMPYRFEQYQFDPVLNNNEKFDFVMSLDNFISALNLKLSGSNFMTTAGHISGNPIVKRQVSPRYEDYNYIGHNELDITPANKKYSLLFEKG